MLRNQILNHHILTGHSEVIHAEKAEEQVAWPNDRTLGRIEALYQIPFSEKIEALAGGAKILDIGPGRGAFLNELLQFSLLKNPGAKPLKCYGITTTKVDATNLAKIRELTYCAVPTSKNWLERHFNFFDFGFDTYAALTYSDNPLHSLIYILLTMAPNSHFYAMSSLTYGDTENSCFGHSQTREAIKLFFQKILGVNIEFELIKIDSVSCKPGEKMDDLRIHVKIPATGLQLSAAMKQQTSWHLFKSVCQLADQEIGVPRLMAGKTAFQAGHYHITMREYLPLQLSAQSSLQVPQ